MDVALVHLLEWVLTKLMGNQLDLGFEVVATFIALKQCLWFTKVSLTVWVDFDILPVEANILLDLFNFEVVAAVVIVAWSWELVD